MTRLLLLIFHTTLIAFLLSSCDETNEQPNVLFIAVDDLRPELGCYGQKMIKSPNIDRLASEGTTFTNAFCNVPVCGASRASLLTGIRPTRTRFVNYDSRMSEDTPEATTIPQHFKQHGYTTISLGKVAHFPEDNGSHWSEPPWRPDYQAGKQVNWRNYESEENLAIAAQRPNKAGLPYEQPDVEDNAYYDGKITEQAVEHIKKLADADNPFFLAVGFLKPHLPFNAPKKYWDLYAPEQISLPPNYFRPENAPDIAMHNFGELRSYHGIPREGLVPDEMALNLIHGYYACVSYIDAQIGRLMETLEESDLAENTIVILWGDHGWNLGEHTLWCKHSTFKNALRVPLIVKSPWDKANQHSSALIEYIDVFPTMCDLAGLPHPSQLMGNSFVPVIKNPDVPWKQAVFSQWQNAAAVTTERYTYTEWTNDQGQFLSKMLYDHEVDPQENINIAEVETHQALVEEMKKLLHQGP